MRARVRSVSLFSHQASTFNPGILLKWLRFLVTSGSPCLTAIPAMNSSSTPIVSPLLLKAAWMRAIWKAASTS